MRESYDRGRREKKQPHLGTKRDKVRVQILSRAGNNASLGHYSLESINPSAPASSSGSGEQVHKTSAGSSSSNPACRPVFLGLAIVVRPGASQGFLAGETAPRAGTLGANAKEKPLHQPSGTFLATMEEEEPLELS